MRAPSVARWASGLRNGRGEATAAGCEAGGRTATASTQASDPATGEAETGAPLPVAQLPALPADAAPPDAPADPPADDSTATNHTNPTNPANPANPVNASVDPTLPASLPPEQADTLGSDLLDCDDANPPLCESELGAGAQQHGAGGDPVSTAFGNYTETWTDLLVPGPGESDLVLARTYNSLAGRYDVLPQPAGQANSLLGRGWSSLLTVGLVQTPGEASGDVVVQLESGRTLRFRTAGEGFTNVSATPSLATLSRSAEGYRLTTRLHNVYTFDADGRPLSWADRNGNALTYRYGEINGQVRLARLENSGGRSVELGYNAAGQIAEVRAPEGIRLRYGYEGDHLVSFSDARGHTWRFDYTAEGQLATLTSPNGYPLRRMSYDAEGRAVEQIVGEAERYLFAYDDAQRLRSITDGLGNVTVHRYDERWRLVEQTDARGYVEQYGYSDEGRRTHYVDGEGRAWQYVYDERGNLIYEAGPLGWVRQWRYSSRNRLTSTIDALGRETRRLYDERGNLVTTIDALGHETQLRYDAQGNVTQMIDANGHATELAYSPAGDLVRVVDALGRESTLGYDGLGRVVSMTTPAGESWSLAYAGALVAQVEGPAGWRQSYKYDANGNLVSETDPNGNTTEYAYTASDQLGWVRTTDGYEGSVLYNMQNQIIRRSDPLSGETHYRYHSTGEVAVMQLPDGTTTEYAYNGVGSAIEITEAESGVTRYVYDDLDRVVEMIEHDPSTDGPTDLSTRYTYDLVGNMLSVTNPQGEMTTFTYNALNLLTAERDAAGNEVQYEYNAVNNLTHANNDPHGAIRYVYNALGRPTALEFANGQVIPVTYAADDEDSVQPSAVGDSPLERGQPTVAPSPIPIAPTLEPTPVPPPATAKPIPLPSPAVAPLPTATRVPMLPPPPMPPTPTTEPTPSPTAVPPMIGPPPTATATATPTPVLALLPIVPVPHPEPELPRPTETPVAGTPTPVCESPAEVLVPGDELPISVVDMLKLLVGAETGISMGEGSREVSIGHNLWLVVTVGYDGALQIRNGNAPLIVNPDGSTILLDEMPITVELSEDGETLTMSGPTVTLAADGTYEASSVWEYSFQVAPPGGDATNVMTVSIELEDGTKVNYQVEASIGFEMGPDGQTVLVVGGATVGGAAIWAITEPIVNSTGAARGVLIGGASATTSIIMIPNAVLENFHCQMSHLDPDNYTCSEDWQ